MHKSLIVFILVTLVFSVESGQIAAPDEVLDTIAQINHMNWVVTKIKNYNNAIVLEEEYEKISPGMLNLNRIPDKETLGKIMALLDELHAMRKAERDMKFWRDHFDAERKQQQLDHWKRRIKEYDIDVGKVVSGAARIAIGDPTTVLEMGKAVAATSLDEYSAYYSFAQKVERDKDKKIFDFETEKLDAMHKRNKDMLQDQWDLIRKYKLDDTLRVAESDLLALIEILKDPDPAHIYPRIEPLKSRFPTFPVYWYYLSTAALEATEFKVGLEACDTFFRINRGLFRDDPMSGVVALNKAMMMEKNDLNRDEIRRCLDECRRQTAIRPDWQRDYICASLYASFLKDRISALHVLKRAISILENNVRNGVDALRRIALSEDSLLRYGEADFPDGDALAQCRRLYQEIESGDEISNAGMSARSLGAAELVSPVENLEFVGRLSADQIWAIVGDDVENVMLRFDTAVRRKGKVSWGMDAEAVAKVPMRWFLSGRLSIEVCAMSNKKVIVMLPENKKLRRAVVGDCIELHFPVEKRKLSDADSFVLKFKHSRYPSSMVFASASPYVDTVPAKVIGGMSFAGKFAADKICDDLRLYEVIICGKTFLRSFEGRGTRFAERVREDDWQTEFAKVFRNISRINKGNNKTVFPNIEGVEISDDGMVIHYINNGKQPFKPSVSVFLLSQYGTILGRVDDIWRFKKIVAGAKGTSEKFPLSHVDSLIYMDVEIGE